MTKEQLAMLHGQLSTITTFLAIIAGLLLSICFITAAILWLIPGKKP
jgi:hypothetical protein